jgi:predicted transcriptional regulator
MAKRGPGRPMHEKTKENAAVAEAMSGYGMPHAQIALQLGICEGTLRKHYSEELARGVPKANSQIAQAMFKKAINGDSTLLIWWSKTRMGWKETSALEVTGANGGPLQHQHTTLTPEQAAQLAKELGLPAQVFEP